MSTENDTLSVAALLAGLREGDERAAALFVERYGPLLHRVLRVTGVIRWAQSQLESQDLAQSVFAQVIEAIRAGQVQLSDRAGLEGFLTTTARNRLRDHIRRLKAARRDTRRNVGAAAALAQVAEAAPGPSEVVQLREEVARVEDCTPPEELEILRARADGAEWQDLAAAQATTPEALRKRIERVRTRIRKTLGE